MLVRPLHTLLRHIRTLFHPQAAGTVTDAELLERFLDGKDEAAFELLVWRHGPMVLGVCRRILQDPHEAEDAFQAAFFTLARKAGSIGRRDSVGAWLYRVAYRIALRARARRVRQAQREQPLGDLPVAEVGCEPADLLAWSELRPVLDAEVNRLPEKYRAAFVLCYLEGKTNEQAAEQLGCPKGTILSRLSRARERLRKRLMQRGVVLAALPLARVLLQQAQMLADVSPVLVNATVQLALLAAVGSKLAGLALGPAARMAEDMLRQLRLDRLRLAAGALAVLALLLLGSVFGAAALPPSLKNDGAAPASMVTSPGTSGGCHSSAGTP
jgi:RNA polymerase sigma factor (sigma-70 family)